MGNHKAPPCILYENTENTSPSFLVNGSALVRHGFKYFIGMLQTISVDCFLMGRFLLQISSRPQPRSFHHREADCSCSPALVTHPHLRPRLLDTLSRSGNWRYRFSLYHLGALSDLCDSLLCTKTCVLFLLRSAQWLLFIGLFFVQRTSLGPSAR